MHAASCALFRTLVRAAVITVMCSAFCLHAAAPFSLNDQPQKKKKDHRVPDDSTVELSPFCVAGAPGGSFAAVPARLGVTTGGFKDINFARTLMSWGMLPDTDEFTAEGLFSEHDLPTPQSETATQLIAVTGDAKMASILNKPQVTHLAQIGFASNLDATTWRREPIYLVLVIDVSGSMSEKMELVKATLDEISDRLGPDDFCSIVRFSTDATLQLPPTQCTPANRLAIRAAIESLQVEGGTNIEAGLHLGFEESRAKSSGIPERRRVMLITDEMPNIGADTPESFMALAETASLGGTGLTTIGVGLDFDAGFVKKVSAVSGGNAFYFSDAAQMKAKIETDFDFMVTELAFDLQLRMTPAQGVSLVDVYGIPGEAYTRTSDGGLLLDVPTLFLSREKGAIFVSVAAPAVGNSSANLGHVELSYVERGSKTTTTSSFDWTSASEHRAGLGLCRGEMLINEYEALRGASQAFYHDGNLVAARAQADALAALFEGDNDAGLQNERGLVGAIATFLDRSASKPRLDRRVLKTAPEDSPLCGLWNLEETSDGQSTRRGVLALLPSGHGVFLEAGGESPPRVTTWENGKLQDDDGGAAELRVSWGRLSYVAKRDGESSQVVALRRANPGEIWGETTAVP